MQKLTLKAENKSLQDRIDKLEEQMSEQNDLMARLQREANVLVDKYNKLAGKINSIRTLVTSND
jgi:hypothetical protein